MTPNGRLGVLHGIRMQVEALIAEEEAALAASVPQVEQGACPNCGAPEEKQDEVKTMDGRRRIRCMACRLERAA